MTLRQTGLSFLSWGGIVWLPSGWVVADRDPDLPLPDGAPDLVAFRPDGSEFHRLPIGPRAECWRDETWRPSPLSDGRLGFVRECYPKEREGRDFSYNEIELGAFDMTSEHVESLADLGDVWIGDIRLILFGFVCDPVCRHGWGTWNADTIAPKSGVTCGTVSREDISNWSCESGQGPGPNCRWIMHTWEMNFDSLPGDSGGPVFRRFWVPQDAAYTNQAYGTHVHSTDGSNARSWYSPVTYRINAYDLLPLAYTFRVCTSYSC